MRPNYFDAFMLDTLHYRRTIGWNGKNATWRLLWLAVLAIRHGDAELSAAAPAAPTWDIMLVSHVQDGKVLLGLSVFTQSLYSGASLGRCLFGYSVRTPPFADTLFEVLDAFYAVHKKSLRLVPTRSGPPPIL